MSVLHTYETASLAGEKGSWSSPTELPDAFFKTDRVKQALAFHAPRYDELPTIELYREQIITYIDGALSPLSFDSESWLTPSMVNNYVKLGVIDAPIKKAYSRDHVAHLMAVCILKQVLPISSIKGLLRVQERTYDLRTAYDYFVVEFEHALAAVFLSKPVEKDTASRVTRETQLIRCATYAVASRIFLQGYLAYLEQ